MGGIRDHVERLRAEESLMNAVTALKVMTDRQLSAIYIEAVKAAKRRGEKLSAS